MNKDYYAVIMAGGVGSRFWPVSTSAYPKQFHDMLGTGDSLIQKTFKRLSRLVPEDQILISTNDSYKDLVQEQLPQVSDAQLVLEPVMRNTAPCILMAALKIHKENPNAVMVVAPSDHWIEDEQAFTDNIKTCFEAAAQEDILMTLGINPTFPNTGYGYIQYQGEAQSAVKPVIRFTEKPDYETAKAFLAEGNYVWNSGMFIWSVASIVKAFETRLPAMHALFMQGMEVYNTDKEFEFVGARFPEAVNISIDYGIMEQADNVRVLPATFDWNDLGAWGALYDKLPKDNDNNVVVRAKAQLNNATGNMIYTAGEKVVVLEDLHDFIVVEKKDVLVVVPKAKEQEIKRILNQVKENFGTDYA
ncbi:mannose-1-phosphate guanylyltransferase [Gilvibacter sediminis]|uniref:mannose-1-phosphate guanylyltransferase n=1 Tax=Gilvibacter sediminis TaxID=379071 RepID=UPI002350538C|nr:mannose-1-phosphate guanylyltransferase [Gilvibacter sediminis]MDC7997577.1 mannose-1-phosphate guanylyltransferase [Gilvibacter sediminis]